MALINRTFGGKMNLDTSPNRVPQQDYINALNITRDAQGQGQDKIISNIVGNQRVSYNLPTGTNKRIGSKVDPVRNRIYYFIWNSYSQDLILYYDRTLGTIVKLIENLVDTGGVDVLNFNPSKRINCIDIIYRDLEGDLLSWTDGYSTPKEINVQEILDGTFGVIQKNFIEAAKMPPIYPPTCVYQSDTTRTGNALRRLLFQFSYAWRYDTFAISTPSTFSSIPMPTSTFGSDVDLDSTNDNNIAITVDTGDKNVRQIEIYMRSNNGDAWNNFVTIIVLDKDDLNIPDNSTYQYLFYNDSIYPTPTQNFQYVDGVQVVPLFDWIPQLADTQCQANGNYKIYGAITENYDNYPVNSLDVTLTAANQTNIPPDTTPPQITYTVLGAETQFTVSGSVPVGTSYKIYIFFNGDTGLGQTHGVFLVGNYTSILGDTINDVAFALYSQFNSYPSNPIIIGSYSGNTWQSNFGTAGSYVFRIDVVPGTSVGSISSQKTWLWDCPYALGIVYVDEQNRDIPGVTTYSNPNGGDNDFVVTTNSFSLYGTTPQTPVLSFSINHLPPADAVAYHLVRRRLAIGTFLYYETCDFQDPNDGYLYFCLANVDKFKEANSQFIYGAAPITSESRIKIIAGITSTAYNGTFYTNYDFQILGTVTRTLTGGVSPDDDVLFVKVLKPQTAVSPAFTQNMLVMVYTPAANPTSDTESVYYEFGQTYGIYTLDGVRYHEGMNQNQTASQAATFTFIEGDVYYRQRQMYNSIVGAAPYDPATFYLMDANYSDYFDSLVNDNGRGQAIEANARKQFNPTLVRFSEAYQSGTNVNELNRFYPENFDEYNRQWGAIRYLCIDKYLMYVFHEFNTGVVPVFTQIVRDTQGNPLEANSETLLNKITYPYDKQYGLGDVPESFAYGKGAMYGIDSNKAVVWRLSNDGMTAISVLYECNAFFVAKLAAYKTNLNNGYTYCVIINATSTITITSIGAVGDNTTLQLTDPDLGVISFGTYTVTSGDTDTTILATNAAAVWATNSYGYGVTSVGNVITITARTGLGAAINGVAFAATTTETKARAFLAPTLTTTGTVYTTTVNDPSLGVITLSSYTQQVGDTTQAIFISNLITSINTNIYGYSAIASGTTALYVVAKTGVGSEINGNAATVTWGVNTNTSNFSGGIGLIPSIITVFEGGGRECQPYTGNPTVYGVFDSYTNKYIINLEEINRYNSQGYLTFHQNPYTIVFLETRDATEGFETFTSYFPEGMSSLNNLLVSFKNGELWTHDNDTFCNFYGIQYPCYIDGVFNDNLLEKKTWQALTEISPDVWECPTIYTNVYSYQNQLQQTKLTTDDFIIFEQEPSASFLRDLNSIGGLNSGDFMKGNYIVIRFQKDDTTNLVILAGVSVLYKDSGLTAR